MIPINIDILEMTVKPIALLLLVSWLCASASAALAQQEIVTLSTRAGVTQSYFLTSIPPELRAVAILLPGSGGLINLRSEMASLNSARGIFSCAAGRSSSKTG